MKRFPNGIAKSAFYQQRHPEAVPPGVRRELLPDDIEPIDEEDGSRERLIGGSLTTLVYMTQLAAISQDPWFSRVSDPTHQDYTAIDLDPGDEAGFDRILDVARWVKDELDRLSHSRGSEDVGFTRAAHLHSAAAADDVRDGAVALPHDRVGGGDASSEDRDDRAHGQAAPARDRLRGLSAEHSRQDARDGVFRPRERLRRRLHAPHVAGSRGRRRIRASSRCGPCSTGSPASAIFGHGSATTGRSISARCCGR